MIANIAWSIVAVFCIALAAGQLEKNIDNRR